MRGTLLAAVWLLAAPAGATTVAFGVEGGIVEADAFPAGIDADAFRPVVTGLGRVQDVEYVGGRYYWTDLDSGKIQSAQRDGSDVQDLIVRDPSVAVPRFLAVDAAGGKLYWTEFQQSDQTHRIHRADLDGANPELLYTSPSARSGLGGLALDPTAGRIYFFDFYTQLRSIALDGTDPTVLDALPVIGGPGGGIDFDAAEQRIFFAAGTQMFRYSLADDATTGLLTGNASLIEFFGGVAYDAATGEVYVNYSEDLFDGVGHQFALDAENGGFVRGPTSLGVAYPGGIAIVPEPATLLCVALGLALIGRTRRV